MNFIRILLGWLFICALVFDVNAQTDKLEFQNTQGLYQIYLKKPAKEIIDLQYHKTCEPVKGRISDDGKKVIMENYEPGSRMYLQILYSDSTVEEFVRSPCFIDPVIL